MRQFVARVKGIRVLLLLFFACMLAACTVPAQSLAAAPSAILVPVRDSNVQSGGPPLPFARSLVAPHAAHSNQSVEPQLGHDGEPNENPKKVLVLGESTLGYPIVAYSFGTGARRIAFVGAIHGGYEWNTALLAYRAIDYFAAHAEAIPVNVTLFIIPTANPDGQVSVTGTPGHFSEADVNPDNQKGRFNGNGVDLNRNWACDWEPIGMWGATPVNAGSSAMSEVETVALATFLTDPAMGAVVFWHSALNSVYAGGCLGDYAAANQLAAAYATSAAYPFEETFANYRVTGDATNWLSLHGVPAITVELATHESMDWPQNLAGMFAVITHVAAAVAGAEEP